MKSLSKIALAATLALSAALAPSANALVGILTFPTDPIVGGVAIGVGAGLMVAGGSATVVRCHRVPGRPYRGPYRPRRPGHTVCSRQAVGGGVFTLGLLLLDEKQGFAGAEFRAPSIEQSIAAGLSIAEATAVKAEELKIQGIDDEVNAGSNEAWDSIAQATLSAEAYSGIKKIQAAATQE
jgi:hypothetical protein